MIDTCNQNQTSNREDKNHVSLFKPMGVGEQANEEKHQKRETYEKFFQYS